MPSVIVFNCGGDTSVHISDLEPREVAEKIADYFEGYSTDNETTSVVKATDTDLTKPYLTVVLTNEHGDDGSGPDHDLAYVLDFSIESVRWALAKADRGYGDDISLTRAGVLVGKPLE